MLQSDFGCIEVNTTFSRYIFTHFDFLCSCRRPRWDKTTCWWLIDGRAWLPVLEGIDRSLWGVCEVGMQLIVCCQAFGLLALLLVNGVENNAVDRPDREEAWHSRYAFCCELCPSWKSVGTGEGTDLRSLMRSLIYVQGSCVLYIPDRSCCHMMLGRIISAMQ